MMESRTIQEREPRLEEVYQADPNTRVLRAEDLVHDPSHLIFFALSLSTAWCHLNVVNPERIPAESSARFLTPIVTHELI